MAESKTAQEELHEEYHNGECCGNKSKDRTVFYISALAIFAIIFNAYAIIDTYGNQKGVSWQCVEWTDSYGGLGQTFWQNECKYSFKKQNMTCESYIDEGKTDDYVWKISKNGTFINETRMPCSKYIYIKRPMGDKTRKINM